MIKKDTGKFWSFKDTTNYKNTKYISRNFDVIRTFIFDKSFLLEIEFEDVIRNKKNKMFIIPLKYVSSRFPNGHYSGIGPNKNLISFIDDDILRVIC